MSWLAQGRHSADLNRIPGNAVVVLLGAPRESRLGGPNLYYWHRIDATVALYRAGKVQQIIVSDVSPGLLRQDLVACGVPSGLIKLDGADRTIDSVINNRRHGSVLFVSQAFHNERALFMADRLGVSAQGFDAQDVRFPLGILMRIRELGSRIRMLFELPWQ
ncbi:ElyC/SanA/YdcF family protein [Chitinimonas sp. DQS-5]|uniref:ElyC/SanA/YdcF family protein n=1 Tax=Parachitinimonas caeni TaxID=3031301 RepID=A0ABT7DR21_9NEIS|nr:ElyC/SanA/YdcF family protein [Parachitinimonas caeni]